MEILHIVIEKIKSSSAGAITFICALLVVLYLFFPYFMEILGNYDSKKSELHAKEIEILKREIDIQAKRLAEQKSDFESRLYELNQKLKDSNELSSKFKNSIEQINEKLDFGYGGSSVSDDVTGFNKALRIITDEEIIAKAKLLDLLSLYFKEYPVGEYISVSKDRKNLVIVGDLICLQNSKEELFNNGDAEWAHITNFANNHGLLPIVHRFESSQWLEKYFYYMANSRRKERKCVDGSVNIDGEYVVVDIDNKTLHRANH